MFAVPGWSVSADKLKAETATGAPKSAGTDSPSGNGAKQEHNASSKKRKRPQADVTSSNVADLWEQVIEGKPAGGNKKKAKKQQAHDAAAAAQSTESRPASNEASISGKKNKTAPDSKVSSPQAARKEAPAVEGSQKLKKQKSRDQVSKAESEEDAPEDPQQNQPPTCSDHAENGKKSKKNKAKKGSNKPEEESGQQHQPPAKSIEAKLEDDQKSSLTRAVAAPAPAAPKLTPLQAAMREKLISARFRYLNETLYTKPSAEAFRLFEDTPEMFSDYHEGFRRQVDVWPENPVDGYIADIKQRGQQRVPHKGKQGGGGGGGRSKSNTGTGGSAEPLPRTSGTCTIADLGCGDAKLAAELQSKKKALRLEILSYDLQSPSPHVTRADIANLPLADGSVNVAIFCLALMGTNWLDFVEEAYRVLHWKGELWVAEIKSRLGHVGNPGGKKAPGGVVNHSVGNRKKAVAGAKKGKSDDDDGGSNKMNDAALAIEVDGAEDRRQETDVTAFVDALRKRGFVLQGEPDLRNKMFVKMHFLKAAPATVGKNAFPERAGGGGAGGQGANANARMGRVSSKFVDAEDEKSGDKADEASILKPCVYKIR